MGELYHLTTPGGDGDGRLSFLAHAVRATIADKAVRRHASLDW
jgi:hypothetical protein